MFMAYLLSDRVPRYVGPYALIVALLVLAGIGRHRHPCQSEVANYASVLSLFVAEFVSTASAWCPDHPRLSASYRADLHGPS